MRRGGSFVSNPLHSYGFPINPILDSS